MTVMAVPEKGSRSRRAKKSLAPQNSTSILSNQTVWTSVSLLLSFILKEAGR